MDRRASGEREMMDYMSKHVANNIKNKRRKD